MCNDNVLDLAGVVDSEIKSKQLYVEEKIPADFAFAIHDKDDPTDKRVIELLSKSFKKYTGCSSNGVDGLTRDDLGLTGEFDGERIQVKVEIPYQLRLYGDCGRGQKKESDKRINLTVKVFKKNGKMLTFDVCASRGIKVESVSIEMPPSDDDPYPHSQDFMVVEDSRLHLGLKEYLRVRGIDRSTADFLHKYMRMKSKNQPVIVLKKLKKFLEK